jgi:hypothetical protein
MADDSLQWWDLWYPGAGATGLSFARGHIDPSEVLWVHSAPDELSVRVRDDSERLVASGHSLERVGERFPMTRLERQGDEIVREDRWPVASDVGALVILPGGEVGALLGWWNAEDGSEWRWQVEFYNQR